jgi:hypothetical protein
MVYLDACIVIYWVEEKQGQINLLRQLSGSRFATLTRTFRGSPTLVDDSKRSGAGCKPAPAWEARFRAWFYFAKPSLASRHYQVELGNEQF